MAADNIREIFRTDTVGEFMDKCNWNFGIISRLGGPRGLQGEQGETGARGRRGAMMHVIDGESMSGMDFDTDSANEILENLDEDLRNEIEDGDVAVFSNGWVCGVNVENDSITVNEPLFSIVGPQGERGATGASGDTLFTDTEDMASLNGRRQLLIDNTIYLPSNNSNSGGIVFSELEEREGGVYNGMTNTKAHINFKNDGLSINSNNNIRIGTSSSINEINFNIGNGNDIMKVNNNGVNLYNSLNFNASTGKITKSGNIITLYNDKTTFNTDIKLVGNSYTITRDNNSIVLLEDFTTFNKPIITINDGTAFGRFDEKSLTFINNPIFLLTNVTGSGLLYDKDSGEIKLSSRYITIYGFNTNITENNIKVTKDDTKFEKPITLKTASGTNYQQIDFDNDGVILKILESNTLKNKTIAKKNKTTFYKPVELTAMGVTETTTDSSYYNQRTAKIEYKYSQSDGSYLNIDKPVKAVVNGESVFLGVPAYTITPYPSASNAPTGWELFDDNILMAVDNNSSTYAFNVRYNSTSYRIPAVSGLNDESFASLVASEEKTFLGIGTPKLTDNVKNSTSELLELSSTIALQNVSEQSPYAFIATLGDFEDKGGKKETKPEFMKYENLMKKISANNKDMKDIFTAITDSDNTILAFAYPKPKAPTGFTYIIKTA